MAVTFCETPTEIMIPKGEHHGHHKETFLVKVMKSLWYTVALWALILGSSVIFMGIEGNHQQLVGWKNMEHLEQFNKSLHKWITKGKGPNATAIRAKIGLHENLTEHEYIRLVQHQMNESFTYLLIGAKAKCNLAKHDLKSWSNMTYSKGDAFMYSVSILSTVGWGVYAPSKEFARGITMLYACFGIPLFTAFIGFQMRFVEYVEYRMKKNKIVMKYMGGSSTINASMGLVLLAVALAYSKFSLHMVNEEKHHPDIKQDLEDIGQANHWHYFTSIYFTFQTVSTIGFGDEYIFSPDRGAGVMLYVKPIFLIVFTSFLIALFSHIFGKLQDRMDRKAEKRSRQSSLALRSLHMGVRKASMAVSNRKSRGEIPKGLEVLGNKSADHNSYDVMFLRHSVDHKRNGPIEPIKDVSLGSEPSSSTIVTIKNHTDEQSVD